MPINTKKQLLKAVRNRTYLAKDFDSLRASLYGYAKTYFPDRIKDFSDASFGGLLLDLAAYVGDINSFYLDHQFHEISPETAIENNNIVRHLRDAGVPIIGASPAIVDCTFYVRIPADSSTPPIPNTEALPVINQGSAVKAKNGVEFELTEDINFTKVDAAGYLKASIEIGARDANNNPTNYILSLDGTCISGKRATETFTVNGFESFKRITLSNESVSEITRVTDTLGNEYYEVDHLTQDTVYKAVANTASDSDTVEEVLVPIPAPYRFVKQTDFQTKLTTLTFGGARADTLNDDIIPDPSEYAIPLYGKKTFTRFSIAPESLLQTTTLGILTPNTTLTVLYRYGGGLNHNVEANSIRDMSRLDITFPNDPLPSVASYVRNSIDVLNVERAAGGDDPPTINDLKAQIPKYRAAQSRVVSKPDLLARVYTMPSNFGRVYRAGVQPNPDNPLAIRLFVVCKNSTGELVIAPDTLKKNLAEYLNKYRMISDAIDILDARVINIKVQFNITADPTMNKGLVLRSVLSKLKSYFQTTHYHIDQPIVIGDLYNVIYNNVGVMSVASIGIANMFGVVGSTNPRTYSNVQYDINANVKKGIVHPPPGGIFELKYSNFDLIGSVL